jgi:hypothetical protein
MITARISAVKAGLDISLNDLEAHYLALSTIQVDRIAALAPPPRIHHHRYFGVLAPNAPLRAAVTALALAAPTAAVATAPQPGSRHRTGPPPRRPLCLGAVAYPYL